MKQRTESLFLSCTIVVLFLLAACSKSPAPQPAPPNPPSSGNGSGNSAAEWNLQTSGNQCINVSVAGEYKQQVILTSAHTVSIAVAVTKAGAWSLTTTSVNGISFSGSGSFTSTGNQTILLKGSGTPSDGGSFQYAITQNGVSCSFAVSVLSNSIVYIRGIEMFRLSFDETIMRADYYASSDEVSGSSALSLSRIKEAGDTIVTKLVNVHKGTVFIWEDYYDMQGIVSFSNVNDYTSGGSLANVDTVGKLQVWFYRKDGKDIVPASNGRPAIKLIVQVPGKFKDYYNTPPYQVYMPYSNLTSLYPWHSITNNAQYMESLFANQNWKLLEFRRRH